jgi:helicase required for RNAi-mediated heterochromatin assembly 1
MPATIPHTTLINSYVCTIVFDLLKMRSTYKDTVGELNAHVTERFGRTSFRDNSAVPNDNIPSSGNSRVNNDIREYFQLAKKPVTAGSWIDKPEIPDPSEILPLKKPDHICSKRQPLVEVGETLRPHRGEGAYGSNEEYLGTKYELLKEDAIRPLREAVEEFRQSPYKDEAEYGNNSLGIYEPVYITHLVFSPRGLATRVAFSLSRVKKHIRWEQSKRLITGSLVALSPVDDAFQTTCVLATIAARPISALQQNPPEIDLFFARPQDQEVDPMKKWIMIECRASFFEASRHTLLALQHLMREPFPLSEHLVNVEKEVKPPAYVKHNPYMNLSSLVSMEESANFENINVLENWPASSSLSLDKSQSKALKCMLTSKLAIVQGPPGTGKTHVSVGMIKVLRDNLRREDSPIIVSARQYVPYFLSTDPSCRLLPRLIMLLIKSCDTQRSLSRTSSVSEDEANTKTSKNAHCLKFVQMYHRRRRQAVRKYRPPSPCES